MSGLPPNAFATMGTVVSLRLPGGADLRGAVSAAADVFEAWEADLSTFRRDSVLSRVNRGELALADAGWRVRTAYETAAEWRLRTGGVFTPHRADGTIDLDGVVKALAVVEAGGRLDELAPGAWAIDAGGDVLVRGADPVARVGTVRHGRARDVPEPSSRGWRVGVVDPADRARLLGAIVLDDVRRAVATSGIAERGAHIRTADGGDTEFVQVSVASDDLVRADVLATAIVAGGRALLDAVARTEPIDVLAVARDGSLLATPGWPRESPPPP